MPRPRGYSTIDVIAAAMEAFWAGGFEGTGLSDLEDATGLSRSSLYHAFGTKRDLYKAVVDSYVAEFVAPLLDPMECGAPCLSAITSYLATMSRLFVQDARVRGRGCLLINAIGERPLRDDEPAKIASGFPERLTRAFARCLNDGGTSSRMSEDDVERRAKMLAVATLGLWINVRTDPETAARTCADVGDVVASWDVATGELNAVSNGS